MEKKKVKLSKVSHFKAIPGHGITAKLGSTTYFLGNDKLMKKHNISLAKIKPQVEKLEHEGKTAMILSDSKKALGIIAVADAFDVKVSLQDGRRHSFAEGFDKLKQSRGKELDAAIVDVFIKIWPKVQKG